MLHVLIAVTALLGAMVPWLLPPAAAAGAEPWTLGVLTLLAALSGMRCVKPAGRGTWFVPTDAFVLAGIVTVGGRAAARSRCAGVLATSVGVAKAGPAAHPVQLGSVLMATAAGAAVLRGLPSGVTGFPLPP